MTLAEAQVTLAEEQVTAAETVRDETDDIKAEVVSYRYDTMEMLGRVNTLYDNFDDRYLGGLWEDPLTDNDGNALQEGALYWNMDIKAMKVYTGTAWNDVAASSGALLIVNNLSDIDDAATARDNLGVESSDKLDDRDTANRARENHTGTQSMDTITESDTGKIFSADERETLELHDSMIDGISEWDEELLSINGDDSTKYDIAAFTYYIDGVKYEFEGETGRDAVFDGEGYIIVNVDATGIVELTPGNANTPSDLDGALELGVLVTVDGTNVSYTGDSHLEAGTFMKDVSTYVKYGLGTRYVCTACTVSISSSDDLQLDVSGGSVLTPNLDLDTVTGETDVGMIAYYNVGGVPAFQSEVTPFQVSTEYYDDGTDLAEISNNKWVAHTILRSARTGKIYYVPSSDVYATKTDAVDSDVNMGGFECQVGLDVSPIAKVIVQEGATAIEEIIDVRNQTSNVVSASTSTLQTTYDRSSEPEIVTSSSRGAVTIQGGTGDDSDNNIEIEDNNGDLQARITAGGTAEFQDLILPDGTLDAAELLVTPNGNLSSDRVQSALEELQTDLDSLLVDEEW